MRVNAADILVVILSSPLSFIDSIKNNFVYFRVISQSWFETLVSLF